MTQVIRKAADRIASLEIWIIALCLVAGFVSSKLLFLAIIVGGAFWLVRWLGSGRLSVRTPADWPILLLLVMTLITLWVTALPEVTYPQVYRLLSGIILYYAIVNWTTSHARLRLLVLGTILAGLSLALFATVSVQWTSSKFPFIPASLYGYFPILVSDTANPNVMAGSLVIFFPIILGLCLFGWKHLRWYEASLSMLALLSIAAILALTQSRGGLIALVAVLMVMALLRWRWGWILSILGISTVGAIIAWIGVTPVLNAVFSSATLGGIEGRLEVWSRAVYMIQDFPFTGVGMGSFTKVADLLYPFFLYEPGKVEHTHNLFLQIAVDLGIPGLIAWLAILVVVSVIAWQVYHKGRITHNGWYAGLGAGLLCSQVALVVHGMLDSVTWGMVRPAPIVWAVWGLIVTSSCIQYQTAKISVQG